MVMFNDLAAFAAINATQPAAYAAFNFELNQTAAPAAQQSELPTLAVASLCSPQSSQQHAACDCSCDSTAQELLQDLLTGDAEFEFQVLTSKASESFKVSSHQVLSIDWAVWATSMQSIRAMGML